MAAEDMHKTCTLCIMWIMLSFAVKKWYMAPGELQVPAVLPHARWSSLILWDQIIWITFYSRLALLRTPRFEASLRKKAGSVLRSECSYHKRTQRSYLRVRSVSLIAVCESDLFSGQAICTQAKLQAKRKLGLRRLIYSVDYSWRKETTTVKLEFVEVQSVTFLYSLLTWRISSHISNLQDVS